MYVTQGKTINILIKMFRLPLSIHDNIFVQNIQNSRNHFLKRVDVCLKLLELLISKRLRVKLTNFPSD